MGATKTCNVLAGHCQLGNVVSNALTVLRSSLTKITLALTHSSGFASLTRSAAMSLLPD